MGKKRSADNVNQVSGSSPFPTYTLAWPGLTASVDHGRKKRSPFSYTYTISGIPDASIVANPADYAATWPGADVKVDHAGKRKRSAEPWGSLHPVYHSAWPGARVSVANFGKKKRSVVDNVNRVSGSSHFPIYTSAWPGATVSVNHG